MNKSLVLTGMMGVGKSTIGRLIAKKLKIKFIDVDKLIEKKEKKSVKKIFEESGENYFKLGQRKQCHVAIFSVIIIMYWTGFLFYKIKHCSNLQLVTVVQQTPEVEARPENTKKNKTIGGMIQDEGL